MLKIFYLLLLAFCLQPLVNASEKELISLSIREKLELIDPSDRLILENFFRRLFKQTPFAFTLFKSKPFSGETIALEYMDHTEVHNLRMLTVLNFKGCKTWQKYAYLFPLNQFDLKISEYPAEGLISFVLAYKPLCQEVIQQHLAIFQSYLGEQKTASEIFYALFPSSSKDEKLQQKGRETCYGILFGFGKLNSELFEKRKILMQTLYQAPINPMALNEKDKARYGYILNGLQPMTYSLAIKQVPSIHSTIEEFEQLQESMKIIWFLDTTCLYPISNITCSGLRDSEETKALQEKYQDVYQNLVDIYNADNFLEIILTQLTS